MEITNKGDPEEEVLFEGYLSKSYKRRWCVLSPVWLKYFRDNRGVRVCVGWIVVKDIRSVKKVDDNNTRTDSCFTITTKHTTFMFGCSSKRRDIWVEKIEMARKYIHVKNCRKAVYALLMIRKRKENILVKDLWIMIAKKTWETRFDDDWDRW